MRKLRSIGIALCLAGSACGDFSSEEDRFACASDGDCIDGYVCGGHTVLSGKATSYCVEDGDRTLGFFLNIATSPFDCTVTGYLDNGDLVRSIDLAASEYKGHDFDPGGDGTTGGPVTGPHDDTNVVHCDETGTVAQGGEQPCCMVEAQKQGGAKVLCLLEPGKIESVAAQVRYVDTTGGGNQTVFLAFAKGDVPEGPPLVSAEVRNFDVDILESASSGGTSARCGQRARLREDVCGRSFDCVCVVEDDCPPTYKCGGAGTGRLGCWPQQWGEEGVAECTLETRWICESNQCDDPYCG